MSAPTAILQLHHRDAFERNVTRSLGAGALAGVAHLLLARAGLALPLSTVVLGAVVLAVAQGDRMDRLMLRGLGVVLPALPLGFGLTPGWTLGCAAALTGGLLVRAHLCERGADERLGEGRPTLLHYGLGAALCAGLALGGMEVARSFGVRLEALAAPPLVVSVVAGLILALFVGLSSVAAHLGLSPDPVEARCEALLPQLSGELHTLAARALSTYRQCGHTLAQLPREPARDELARTLSRLTQEAVELAAEWTGVEVQLQARAHEELAAERDALVQSAAGATDLLARRQLELAAASLGEELERLGELQVQRERTVARLKAQVALLDRTRVALLGLRSGKAQLKAAELSALSRKVQALSSVKLEEGRLQDAVAAGAELAQVEALSPAAAPVRERS